jgi:hypothetical protein
VSLSATSTEPSGARYHYSGFDSGLYRILDDAKWHFSQENATLHHLQMTTFESKPHLGNRFPCRRVFLGSHHLLGYSAHYLSLLAIYQVNT